VDMHVCKSREQEKPPTFDALRPRWDADRLGRSDL
jgi:hypothetical protein